MAKSYIKITVHGLMFSTFKELRDILNMMSPEQLDHQVMYREPHDEGEIIPVDRISAFPSEIEVSSCETIPPGQIVLS